LFNDSIRGARYERPLDALLSKIAIKMGSVPPFFFVARQLSGLFPLLGHKKHTKARGDSTLYHRQEETRSLKNRHYGVTCERLISNHEKQA
jgi:hypothetical protein